MDSQKSLSAVYSPSKSTKISATRVSRFWRLFLGPSIIGVTSAVAMLASILYAGTVQVSHDYGGLFLLAFFQPLTYLIAVTLVSMVVLSWLRGRLVFRLAFGALLIGGMIYPGVIVAEAIHWQRQEKLAQQASTIDECRTLDTIHSWSTCVIRTLKSAADYQTCIDQTEALLFENVAKSRLMTYCEQVDEPQRLERSKSLSDCATVEKELTACLKTWVRSQEDINLCSTIAREHGQPESLCYQLLAVSSRSIVPCNQLTGEAQFQCREAVKNIQASPNDVPTFCRQFLPRVEEISCLITQAYLHTGPDFEAHARLCRLVPPAGPFLIDTKTGLSIDANRYHSDCKTIALELTPLPPSINSLEKCFTLPPESFDVDVCFYHYVTTMDDYRACLFRAQTLSYPTLFQGKCSINLDQIRTSGG